MKCVTGESYADAFRRVFESDDFSLVKVFGYAGETIFADLIRYDDRYLSGLEVRVLQRSWLAEREDELHHNANSESARIRPWKKSEAIRNGALVQWSGTARKSIRFYERQPLIRGAIFCRARDSERVAIVAFQQWVAEPEDGGSQFKGSLVPAIVVPGDTPAQQQLIRNLESQFDYEWRNCKTLEELDSLEASLGKKEIQWPIVRY